MLRQHVQQGPGALEVDGGEPQEVDHHHGEVDPPDRTSQGHGRGQEAAH